MIPKGKNTVFVISLLALGGCSAADYAHRADEEGNAIIEALQREHVDVRPAQVLRPKEELDSAQEAMKQAVAAATPSKILNLRDVMQLAVQKNRDYQTQREGLFLSALSLSLSRFNFGPKFSSTVSYLFSASNSAQNTGGASASVTGTTVLPTGGDLTVRANTEIDGEDGAGLDTNKEYASSVTTSLTQPLWRGAGYEVSHEALTQAERSAVYSIRSFELFREDFAIQVLTRFYNLVSQKRVLENQRQNLEQFEYLRRRSEALFQVGRSPQIDVLRARQQELSAKDSLLQSEESYQSSLNQFKIFLGLSPEESIDVAGDAPEFAPVRVEESSAIEAALNNRLDFKTSKERLEDAERAVRIQKDVLNPDLDLTVSQTSSTPSSSQFTGKPFEEQSWSAGLSLGLPLDRKSQRNAYRAALIDRDRQRRAHQLEKDNVVEEVRSTLRRLRRAENAIDIQKMIIDSEQKRLKIAQIRFRNGEIGNRDVVEAQQGLLSAQNAYIEDLVNYAIARIQLRRDLGTLFLGADGMPIE